MEDPTSTTGLAGAISAGVAVFLAISGAFHQWFKLQRSETTQVTILSEDRDRWQARAEKAEQAIDEYRAKLNEINASLSDLKQQNAVLIIEMKHMREENEELRASIQKLSGGQNV